MYTVKTCFTIFKSPNNQSSSSKEEATVKHALTKASAHQIDFSQTFKYRVQETGHYQKAFGSQCTSLSLIIIFT